jgi:hypothetical protein
MLSVTEVRIELENASKLSPTWRDARLTSIHSSLKSRRDASRILREPEHIV